MSKLEVMLDEMGWINEPWGLFEPHLWKDKLGDSVWICEIRTTHNTLWSGHGATPLEAVENCYFEALATKKEGNHE